MHFPLYYEIFIPRKHIVMQTHNIVTSQQFQHMLLGYTVITFLAASSPHPINLILIKCSWDTDREFKSREITQRQKTM